jgi:hypothetical protein
MARFAELPAVNCWSGGPPPPVSVTVDSKGLISFVLVTAESKGLAALKFEASAAKSGSADYKGLTKMLGRIRRQ